MKFSILASLCFLSLSCSQDDQSENPEHDIVYVISVDIPTAGKVNQTISIPIKFQVYNGCGTFYRFIQTKNGHNRTIAVEAKYEGNICTDNTPIREVNYEFQPKNTGDYTLKFQSGEKEFITTKISIKK